jgi:flavin reductase (DIM6/NTAB) family NADH-FMN oxidoreductase RutF
MSEGTDIDSFATALGRIPSGLFILTVRHGKNETGMLASWIQQCSFDPPQITVALSKKRDVLEWLSDGSIFTVNVIPESGKALVSHFGKGFDLSESAFEGVEVRRDAEMPPVLLAAHAYIVCRVSNLVDVGDHLLVIGRVVMGSVLHPGHPTVHIRKNGMKY